MNIFLSIVFIIGVIYASYITRLYFKIKEKHALEIKEARKDSVKRSRTVINAGITESLAPILPGFPYNGRDCRHFGSPFDYICIDGMSQNRDSGGEIEINEIVFIDIKTGSAVLTPVQKAIKKTIEDGRVKWITLDYKNL